MSRLSGVLILLVAGAVPLAAQQEPDPQQPRPPLLLTLSRTQRLEAFVRMYLAEFIGAVQRGDTVALAALVPGEIIPDVEKPVAARAGCLSLARAHAMLRAQPGREVRNTALPLATLRLRRMTIAIGAQEDTVARAQVQVYERRGQAVRYAPVEFVVAEVGDVWRVVAARGVLLGVCGLAKSQ